MSLTLYDLFGHLSYLLLIAASIARKMLQLRALAIAAGLASIAYASTWAENPLWIEIFWESAFVLVNVVQIALLWREQRRVQFTEEEEHLYRIRFSHFDRLDFHRLIRAGASETVADGSSLTTRGQPCPDLAMIVEGTVGVYVEGALIAHCGAGDFIGEMSFLSGGNATADTRALGPVRIVRWRADDLRALLRSRSTIQTAMQDLFSINLIDKLVRG